MNKRKILAYVIMASLLGVFGLSAWLASQSRYFEAIAVVGVATTVGWFATRVISHNDDDNK